MTLEHIKTVILILLIILSSLLTWTIWTYQPNYRVLEDEKTVQGVSLSGEERAINEIVFPGQVYCHFSNVHYGTLDSELIERMMKEISRWGYDHFEEISGELEDIYDFIYRNGMTEIVFPASVPMKVFRTFAEVKDKNTSTIDFDRLVIDTNHLTKSHGYVYFVSTENLTVYRSEVPASLVANFREQFYLPSVQSGQFYPHQMVTLENGNKLLVRTAATKMKRYSYLMDSLPAEEFKNALFNDPHFVKRNATSSGEEYYDESTLLSINFKANMLHYVNPAQSKGGVMNTDRLLSQSIDFINGHGGWTGNYRYADIDIFEKTILFRLHHPEGYPIFSTNGISEIYLSWGETSVTQYMRNNFSLGGKIEEEEVWMPSGLEVYNSLIKREGFQPKYLQDLVLGYKMTNHVEGKLLYLEPAWYYKYRDQWLSFPSRIGER